MNYLEAKEIMEFLLSCGINAAFWNDDETDINVYDDADHFLFDIRDVEEWEALKQVAQKIATRLNTTTTEEK